MASFSHCFDYRSSSFLAAVNFAPASVRRCRILSSLSCPLFKWCRCKTYFAVVWTHYTCGISGIKNPSLIARVTYRRPSGAVHAINIGTVGAYSSRRVHTVALVTVVARTAASHIAYFIGAADRWALCTRGISAAEVRTVTCSTVRARFSEYRTTGAIISAMLTGSIRRSSTQSVEGIDARGAICAGTGFAKLGAWLTVGIWNKYRSRDNEQK